MIAQDVAEVFTRLQQKLQQPTDSISSPPLPAERLEDIPHKIGLLASLSQPDNICLAHTAVRALVHYPIHISSVYICHHSLCVCMRMMIGNV